ncbi:MAG: Fe-S-containing protein [Deltaproteobacteria bacterium]|nr:Fe-S-containing protein [Deltaproteobacteria bacterium]
MTIGFPGGCNPVPLAFAIQEGQLVVEAENLEKEKGRFQ